MLLSHFTRSPAPSFAGLGGLNFGALTGFATSFLTMDDMTVSDKKCDTKFGKKCFCDKKEGDSNL